MLKIAKKFGEYSKHYDRVWKAVSEGLSAQEAGFNVMKQAEYVGNQTPAMRQNGDQFGHQHFDQNQKGQGNRPDMPRPRAKQRDDFEMEYSPRVKPGRPF